MAIVILIAMFHTDDIKVDTERRANGQLVDRVAEWLRRWIRDQWGLRFFLFLR